MSKKNLNSTKKELIVSQKNKPNKKKKNNNIIDSNSKQALSRKDIVSYILKYLVSEYKDIDVKDIKNSLESGEDDKHIKILKVKDESIKGSQIVYDVLFTVKPPNSKDNILLYIDLEPQGSYPTSYDIVSRGLSYAFRLLDRQLNSNSIKQNYNSINKVYSIWLDTYSTKEKKGSVNSYTICENIHSGNYRNEVTNYDKLNVTVAYISNLNVKEQYKEIMELLYLIFVDVNTSAKEKLNIIKTEYDNIDIDKELEQMCSFEEGARQTIKEKAYEEGLNQGLSQGINQGFIDATANNVFNCMNSLNMPLDKVIEILKIREDIKEAVIKKIEELKKNI